MKRKKFAGLMLELSRQLHYQYYGTYKGFGKIAKFYRKGYRPLVPNIYGNSYSEIWKTMEGMFKR